MVALRFPFKYAVPSPETGTATNSDWADLTIFFCQLILMIKSTKEKFSDLSEFVKSQHPYDCVEVVFVFHRETVIPTFDRVFNAIYFYTTTLSVELVFEKTNPFSNRCLVLR